jgi:hypothetical protein
MYINTLKLLHFRKSRDWGQKNFPHRILHELSGVPKKSCDHGYGNFKSFYSYIGYLCPICPIWPEGDVKYRPHKK